MSLRSFKSLQVFLIPNRLDKQQNYCFSCVKGFDFYNIKKHLHSSSRSRNVLIMDFSSLHFPNEIKKFNKSLASFESFQVFLISKSL